MCMEQPLPADQSELCGVATDDTIFVHRCSSVAKQRLTQLDVVMEEAGMPKNASKDVNAESHMVALGCDLSAEPPSVEPHSCKLFALFAAFLSLLQEPVELVARACCITKGTEPCP